MFQKIKKNLIIDSLVAFFVISVLFLFWSAERPLQEKWWAIHFEEFKGDNFNFILENHSGEKKFHYEIWQEEEKVQEKEFECLKEECLIEIKDFDKNNFQGKIFLKIFGRDEKKEIYKNFSN